MSKSLPEQSSVLQKELDETYAELSKLRPSLTAIFDRTVWARVTKYYKRIHGKLPPRRN